VSSYRNFTIACLVVVVDQIVKLIVKMNMAIGQEFQVLGDVFKIHFIENPGAAFGLTISHVYEAFLGIFMDDPHLSDTTAKLILTLFSLFAVGFIIYYLHTLRNMKTALPIYVSLILGGAIGNIIDRVFYGSWFAEMNDYEGGLLHGRVVDMFYVDIWQGYLPSWVPFLGNEYYSLWPIFNIADAAISVGIVAIIVFQKKLFILDEDTAAIDAHTPETPADTQAQESPNN
jgi:signal peptidase II